MLEQLRAHHGRERQRHQTRHHHRTGQRKGELNEQAPRAPRREGQRRIYSPRDRVRLRLIMRGKRLGLSLDEIADLINLYDVDPSEVTQLRQFIEVIHARKAVLKSQKHDIEESLAEMDRLEKQCAALLSQKQTRK